jgi:hypothetical protein
MVSREIDDKPQPEVRPTSRRNLLSLAAGAGMAALWNPRAQGVIFWGTHDPSAQLCTRSGAMAAKVEVGGRQHIWNGFALYALANKTKSSMESESDWSLESPNDIQ